MSARDVLKNINLFVDGRGYAGQVEEVTPPKLTLKMEEFRGGGMDAPIEIPMGHELLTASFSMIAYDRDVLAMWGVSVGNVVPFVIRGALESFDGTVKPVIHTMRGRIKELDYGTQKPGEKALLNVAVSCQAYKYEQNGQVIHDIDVANMVRIISGVDVLQAIREALGR